MFHRNIEMSVSTIERSYYPTQLAKASDYLEAMAMIRANRIRWIDSIHLFIRWMIDYHDENPTRLAIEQLIDGYPECAKETIDVFLERYAQLVIATIIVDDFLPDRNAEIWQEQEAV